MTGTHPETSTGLSRAQLRLVLFVVIGIILVVAGTVRGQAEQSPRNVETAKGPTTASDDCVPPRAIDTPRKALSNTATEVMPQPDTGHD